MVFPHLPELKYRLVFTFSCASLYCGWTVFFLQLCIGKVFAWLILDLFLSIPCSIKKSKVHM